MFLDAFSHLYKRVCPSVGPSVRPSVGPSVRPSHTSWISEKWAEFEQNSIRNKKVCHLKGDSKTSTRAIRQNASVVRTPFDLFVRNPFTSNQVEFFFLENSECIEKPLGLDFETNLAFYQSVQLGERAETKCPLAQWSKTRTNSICIPSIIMSFNDFTYRKNIA